MTEAIQHSAATLENLELVGRQAAAYAAAARSSNTRLAYSKQWAFFADWCCTQNLVPLPAAPETVALYLAARASEGRKPATLAQALAAISQMHEIAGYVSPRGANVVREVFKGVKRTHGTAQTQKSPISIDQLKAMVSHASVRDRAILLLGWAGAFRRSELAALDVSDLQFTTQGIVTTVRRSKTDQTGEGRKIGVSFGAPETCPVSAVNAWLSVSGLSYGPLFRSIDRHGNIGSRIDGRDIARIVKRAALSVGLDVDCFSGHSLRAGMVTAALQAGRSVIDVQKTTGHKSIAMLARYSRDVDVFSTGGLL
jgi:integrase